MTTPFREEVIRDLMNNHIIDETHDIPFRWKFAKGKFVISKGDGSYFAIEEDQIPGLQKCLIDLLDGTTVFHQKDLR